MSLRDMKSHGHSNIFFLGVNQSGLGTSSTTNHGFYKALGRLHGPGVNNPLVWLMNRVTYHAKWATSKCDTNHK